MGELVLIRGLPGSGKSTMAKVEFPNHAHLEADMFFIQDGVYSFDATRIKDAHMWCQGTTAELLTQGKSVVVSNTFVKRWEMQYYVDLAEKLGVSLRVEVAKGDFGNVHGVPAEVVARMRDNFEA